MSELTGESGPVAADAAGRTCRITRVTPLIVGLRWRNALFVHLETDDGLTGVGEGLVADAPDTVLAAARTLANQAVVGQSAFSVERLLLELQRADGGNAPLGVSAAIEIAIWDVVGKAVGRPVYDLLGGRIRDRLPAFANGWQLGATTPRDLATVAKATVRRGYRSLKLDPFEGVESEPSAPELRLAVERVEAVRSAVGPGIDLMVDCGGRFAAAVAIAIARDLEAAKPYWFEEPLAEASAAGLAQVARRIRTRLAAGEQCHSRAQLQALLTTHEIDVLQPDILLIGGLLEARKIAAIADAAHLPVSFHSPHGPVGLAAALQLDACANNFTLQEAVADYDAPWAAELVEYPPVPADGAFAVPERPGLGIGEFRPDVARANPFNPIFAEP